MKILLCVCVLIIALLSYVLLWALCKMGAYADELMCKHFEYNKKLKEPKDEVQDVQPSSKEEWPR